MTCVEDQFVLLDYSKHLSAALRVGKWGGKTEKTSRG